MLHAVNYKGNTYGHRIVIHGPSMAVYDPEHPLSCGATAWIETEAPVTVGVEHEDTTELVIAS